MSGRYPRFAARIVAVCLVGAVLAVNAWSQVCPPVPQPPTQQQLLDGVKAARDHGLLWRISKDGHSSYLFGTLHLGTLDWAFPGPSIQRALEATQLIALELDMSDPAVQKAMTQPTPGESRPTLTPELRQRLDAQARKACLPPAAQTALAGVHPIMEAITYTLLTARWEGLDPGYGQEWVLMGFAQATKRPIKGLETVQTQLDVLLPKDPASAQTLLVGLLDQLEKGSIGPSLKRLAQAWADGNLQEIETYAQWCDCVQTEEDRAMLRRTNDDRNPNLARGIDALHRPGTNVFAAVGALHMTGPKGLPLLLEKKGFTVERIPHAP